MTGRPFAEPGAQPRPLTEVHPVGPEAFEDVLPLVMQFPTRRQTPEDWRYTLFTHPWARAAPRGYVLRSAGKTVGFMGTIRSERRLCGRVEQIVNPSSWIVLEEFRYAAILLPRALFRERGATIVNLTPSPSAYVIFKKLGMKPLETEQIVLLPLPGLGPLAGVPRASATLSRCSLADELSGEQRRIYQDLASSRVARHVLLRRDGRECYIIATRGRRNRIPFADIQHVSDREFFWEHRALAQAALAKAMGISALAVAIDRRFLVGPAPRASLSWKADRLYRSSSRDITPEMIDGLYSETMGVVY
jgi:hypothetical protein